MKYIFLTVFVACLFVIGAQAQTTTPATTPTTPGNVSRVTYYRILPGKNNEVTTFIRTHNVPIFEEQKKQGLIISYGYFNKPVLEGPDDWNLGLVITYKNYADAIDFNAERTAKLDAIAIAHYGSADARTKANDQINALRPVASSMLVRGITYNPMPAAK